MVAKGRERETVAPEEARGDGVKQADRVAGSMERYAKALRLIPGGAQLVSRRPTRYAFGISPIYAKRAKGPRIWDVDGNQYIDWVSGIGAIILGYADETVDNAVIEQLRKGNCYALNHELEIELAEELISRVPCAEMVRYAKGGGEACAIAVRIGRGFTGREKVLFCGYHGWHDWYLAANLNTAASLDTHLFPGIEPIGVPDSLAGTAFPFPYGDANALEKLFEEHRDQVACVIMEPLRSEMPAPGYLQAVADLARKHGAVLIFDEVTTGLRFGAGGVQERLQVTPDLAVFAKSLSNGYPMAAVVGKREVMESAAQMFISSTYWSDTIGLRAAVTTLREVESRGVADYLEDFGTALKQRVNELAEDTNAPVRCEGISVHPRLVFDLEDPGVCGKVSTLYIQEMAKRGCHALPSFYLNASQGPAELEDTSSALKDVFQTITRAIEENRLDEALECDLSRDAFRRLVN